MTDYQKLVKAFANLKAIGFFTSILPWECCNTCGNAALPEGTKKYVFFHAQNAAAFFQSEPEDIFALSDPQGGFVEAVEADGKLHHSLYLSFGDSAEDGREIVNALTQAGLTIHWEGHSCAAIVVLPFDATCIATSKGIRCGKPVTQTPKGCGGLCEEHDAMVFSINIDRQIERDWKRSQEK